MTTKKRTSASTQEKPFLPREAFQKASTGRTTTFPCPSFTPVIQNEADSQVTLHRTNSRSSRSTFWHLKGNDISTVLVLRPEILSIICTTAEMSFLWQPASMERIGRTSRTTVATKIIRNTTGKSIFHWRIEKGLTLIYFELGDPPNERSEAVVLTKEK